MEAVAHLKNCPNSARKMRLVADNIRGMKVDMALSTLKFSPKKGYAPFMYKLLKSAIANWEQKNPTDRNQIDALVVKTVFVDAAAMQKRMLPAPQGRGYRVRKRTNHITIIVDTK
jgi:large subunit ribosomal protein L22